MQILFLSVGKKKKIIGKTRELQKAADFFIIRVKLNFKPIYMLKINYII